MRHLIELSAQGIEALAVAIIVVAIAHGTIRYLFHINRQVGGAYEQYKIQLGKALLLGLEFLVAADIVRTVALEPTLQNVMILGLLVIVRTFLSWSLVVEIEGRWPWRAQAETHSRGANEPVGDRARDCSTGSAGS
jgi:uncharacterized membrane protein